MTKGILLALLICALTFGIGYVVFAYPVVLLVPAAAGGGVLTYCFGLIGEEEGW